MNKGKQPSLNSLLKDSSFINWAKESNQNDVAFWNNWIEQNSGHVDIIYDAKAMVLGISFDKTNINISKVDNALGSILQNIEKKTANKSTAKTFSLNKKILRYAAVVVLLMVSAIIINQLNNPNTTVLHKTTYGEIIDLTLPDGTSVVLNGNSQISYSKDKARSLNLVGEAYFRVKPIPSTKAKFWVNTNDLQVEVFGTMFHVNTRKKKTKVVLDEGSVHLKLKNGLEKEMIPGDMVTFSKNNNQISHKSVSKDIPYSLWRDGTYTFNNISFIEVMKNIEFTYGLKAGFKDQKLEKLKLSGGIPNQNLMLCIAAIEKVTGTRIVKKENTLIINKN